MKEGALLMEYLESADPLRPKQERKRCPNKIVNLVLLTRFGNTACSLGANSSGVEWTSLKKFYRKLITSVTFSFSASMSIEHSLVHSKRTQGQSFSVCDVLFVMNKNISSMM